MQSHFHIQETEIDNIFFCWFLVGDLPYSIFFCIFYILAHYQIYNELVLYTTYFWFWLICKGLMLSKVFGLISFEF